MTVAGASNALMLRLFDERWLIDLSDYADPAPLVERLGRLWARVRDEQADFAEADVIFRPHPTSPTQSEDARVRTARIAETSDGAFPYAFSRALTQAAIAHLIGSGLLLHAAGLASADGQRGVVLIAASGTGKSTAARTLGRRFGYLSDELMRVDAEHRMQGLTKPLSIIVPDFPGGKDEHSPDEEGLARTPSTAPVLAAMVCLRRDPEATAAELQPISVHELIAEALPQSSSIWRGPRPLHHLVEAGTRGGGPYRLRYAEVTEGAELIAGLLDSHTPDESPHAWTGHPPTGAEQWTKGASRASDLDSATHGEPGDDAVVTRMPWTDAIESEGEVSLLIGSDFSRIAGIAATAWLLCARPHTVAELVDALVSEHGPHPDADGLVRAALGELVGRGLVRVVTTSFASTARDGVS